jgi:preprotein translocase subunit YajC
MALILPILFAAVIYFLFIRPQQRQVKQHALLVESLEVGDEVLTSSGIYGTVTEIDGDQMLIEVADGVVITMAKRAVAEVAVDEVDEIDLDDSDAAETNGRDLDG